MLLRFKENDDKWPYDEKKGYHGTQLEDRWLKGEEEGAKEFHMAHSPVRRELGRHILLRKVLQLTRCLSRPQSRTNGIVFS